MTGSIAIARRLLVGVGAVALCLGLLVLFGPPVESAIRWPWDDELLLVAFFTAALLLASVIGPFVLIDDGSQNRHQNQNQNQNRGNSSPGAPERVPSTPTPGRELERVLDSRWPASLPPVRRRRIRRRLRRAAIRSLVRTSNCSRETARERLERGVWTDDPVAAAFVRAGGEPDSDSSRLRSLVERIRFPRRAQRTARAVLSRTEEGEHP